MHSMRLIGRVNTDDRRVSPASSSNLQIQKSLSELLSLLLLPKDWCYLWLQAVMVVQSYVDELTIAVNIGIIIDDRSIWVIIALTGIAYPGIWTLLLLDCLISAACISLVLQLYLMLFLSFIDVSLCIYDRSDDFYVRRRFAIQRCLEEADAEMPTFRLDLGAKLLRQSCVRRRDESFIALEGGKSSTYIDSRATR